jgi:CHAD domain-containing protein
MLLTPEQRDILESLYQRLPPGNNDRYRRRAQVLLLYDSGKLTPEVSAGAGISLNRARFWRRQFRKLGMSIFPILSSEDFNRSQAGSSDGKASSTGTDESPPTEAELGGLPFPAPLESSGIQADDSMPEAGRKTMLYQFAEMLSHEEGTRLGVDPEELHDMRVATRRLRAAMDVFGDAFSKRVIKTHLKGLRAIGRALGKVRDLDVFIEKALQYQESHPSSSGEDLEPLVACWGEQRDASRVELIAHLDSHDYAIFKEKFNHFVQTPGKGRRAPQDTSLAEATVRSAAPLLIYTRLSAVQSYGPRLDSATLDELHALRIEFKKLRYTVEFFKEALGEEAKAAISVLKKMQDHLGELNDARVAFSMIGDFLAGWESRQTGLPLAQRSDPKAIADYLSATLSERHHLLVTFPEAWEQFTGPDFRRSLALSIAAL